MVIAEKQEAVLALRVFTEMHRQGLTIPKLAKASGVPLSTVQKICKGGGKQPSIWTIWALAHALDVSLDYLVGDTILPKPVVVDASAGETSRTTAVVTSPYYRPAWLGAPFASPHSEE